MRKLVVIFLIGLALAAIIACGGESAEPTSTTVPAAATEAPTPVPDTPAPAPTATPVPTQAPTEAPQPTRAPEPTSTPEPTATTVPTATPEPTEAPTATPEPTSAPEPTATTVPTATPEPTEEPTATPEPTAAPATPAPTAAPANPVVGDLAPLGSNLLWVAHFSNETKEWSVYDPSGAFEPGQLPLAGQEAPDASDIRELSALMPGQIYSFMMDEAQNAELGGVSRSLPAGLSWMLW